MTARFRAATWLAPADQTDRSCRLLLNPPSVKPFRRDVWSFWPERSFYSILSSDLARSRDWYTSLFGYRVEFDSDWFVHMQDPGNARLELGIMAIDHEIVSERMRLAPTGGLLTLVVDDVDQVHAAAQDRGIEIIEPPTNLFYGQRRMLLADPDGQIVDVSSESPPDPQWLASLSP